MISWYIDSSCICFLSGKHCLPRLRQLRSRRLAEETLSVPDTFRQGIYLGGGVVDIEACPGAGLHAERPVQRPRAVVPGPYRDAKLVENLAHIVRMDSVHLERDGTAPVL